MLFLKECFAQRKQKKITIVTNLLAIFLLLLSNTITTTVKANINNELEKLGSYVSCIYTDVNGWENNFENSNLIEEHCEIYQTNYGEYTMLFVDNNFFSFFGIEGEIDSNIICLSADILKDFCFPNIDDMISINGASFKLKYIIDNIDNLYINFSNVIILEKEYNYCFNDCKKVFYFKSNQYVKDFLNDIIGLDNYVLLDQKENIDSIIKIIDFVFKCMNVILGCCMVVSFLGLINHMLQEVELRRYEIGIKRSIGASTKNIFMQFMLESFLTINVSLFLSIVLILLVNKWITLIFDVSFVYNLLAITVFSMLAGIVPAIKANKISVIDCLKKGID